PEERVPEGHVVRRRDRARRQPGLRQHVLRQRPPAGGVGQGHRGPRRRSDLGRQRRRQHLEPAGGDALPAAAPRRLLARSSPPRLVAGGLLSGGKGRVTTMNRLAVFGLLLPLAGFAPAGPAPEPALPSVRPWTAKWISVPDAP